MGRISNKTAQKKIFKLHLNISKSTDIITSQLHMTYQGVIVIEDTHFPISRSPYIDSQYIKKERKLTREQFSSDVVIALHSLTGTFQAQRKSVKLLL